MYVNIGVNLCVKMDANLCVKTIRFDPKQDFDFKFGLGPLDQV